MRKNRAFVLPSVQISAIGHELSKLKLLIYIRG